MPVILLIMFDIWLFVAWQLGTKYGPDGVFCSLFLWPVVYGCFALAGVITINPGLWLILSISFITLFFIVLCNCLQALDTWSKSRGLPRSAGSSQSGQRRAQPAARERIDPRL
jgi:hypothetical protein